MSKQKIQLSDHFDYSRLLRFVLPCIGTMLFTSIYGIVDGLCVSNFVGKTAFAAVNLIMPVPMLVGSVGFMLGTGGSAIVGITLGEGDREKADRYFSHPVPTDFVKIWLLLSAVFPAFVWSAPETSFSLHKTLSNYYGHLSFLYRLLWKVHPLYIS